MEETIATEQTTEVAPTIAPEEDLEAKLAQLEAEKQKAIEERDNYKKAYLKSEERKQPEPADEDDDERLRRIAREELANSKLLEIAKETDELLQRAVKENKELKLARLNADTLTPPATMGTHSESIAVTDTSVTPQQLAYFRDTLKWTDQDIERYKVNLRKRS